MATATITVYETIHKKKRMDNAKNRIYQVCEDEKLNGWDICAVLDVIKFEIMMNA